MTSGSDESWYDPTKENESWHDPTLDDDSWYDPVKDDGFWKMIGECLINFSAEDIQTLLLIGNQDNNIKEIVKLFAKAKSCKT